MLRLANLSKLTAATALASAVGCSPEVMIARDDGNNGGTGVAGRAGATTGGTVSVGTGGSQVGASGTGVIPIPLGGEGGTENVVVEPPRLLADSVADFSLTQGEHGWFYGYDTGSLESFELLTKKSVITAYVPPSNDVWNCWVSNIPAAHWTQIFQLGAHPNGTNSSSPSMGLLQRAVRRWVSNFEGSVTISGEIAKIDVVPGSNGVEGSVYVDQKLTYSTPIGGEDGGGRAYEVVASLHVDSTVDFVLDPLDGDDHHDLSRFTGIIVRVDTGPSQ